jgi:hypothetical protein
MKTITLIFLIGLMISSSDGKMFNKLAKKSPLSISFVQVQQTPNDWTYCAAENGTCSIFGTSIVRYGADDDVTFQEATNSISCTNSGFGNDPAKGTVKECSYKNVPYTWVSCSGENSTCSFSGSAVVKYGYDTKFYYKWVSESVSCSNSVWGDPYSGKVKACYVAVDSDYSKCAGEGETCDIDGTKIVRYGINGSYLFKEIVDLIDCTDSAWGSDPASGVIKQCDVKITPYTWIYCASENGTCTFTGTSTLVRYGNNGVFNYKIGTDSIACTNAQFKDPLYGVVKICQYLANVSPNVASEVTTLSTANDVSVSLTESDAESSATCSNGDGGFGFTGTCLIQPSSTTSAYAVPTSTRSALSFIYGIMQTILIPFNVCVGDYSATDFEENSQLFNMKSEALKMMDGFKYGVIGAVVYNVPCGVTPQSISFITAFDKCGTVAVVFNAGIIQCAATYSTGIAAIISPISSMLDFFSFGISANRRFTIKDFWVAYRSGDKVVNKQITTYGHFMIGLGLSLPLHDLNFGGVKMDDIISFDLQTTFMIDFGNLSSTVSSLVTQVLNATKTSYSTILQTIMKTNAEMTLQVKGKLSLNLGDLTRGFFPDLEFEIGTANLLLSAGGSGAASGMARGLYMSLDANISDAFNAVINQFSNIFKIIGIPSFSLPSLNVRLGIFVESDAVGFEFNSQIFTLKCMFILDTLIGSCNNNSQFFTALIKAGKWIIKHATQLFDQMGADVVSFGYDIKNFATNAADAATTFFTGDARTFFERNVANFAINTGGKIQKTYYTAANAVSNTAVKAVNTVGNGITKGATEVKRFFRKW